MYRKIYLYLGWLILILPLCLLFVSCDIFNNDDNDDNDDNNNGTGSGYSYTITDNTLNAPNGRFFTKVYSGASRTYSSDISTSGALTNGNSVTINGLSANGTPYLIFIWIDEDGDGVYGDDYKGTVNQIDTITTDVEIETSGSLGMIDFKPITINVDQDIGGYLRCYWLLGGTLDDTAKDLLGTWSDTDDPDTLVGRYADNMSISAPSTSITESDIIQEFWPVITMFYSYFDLEYDCYCFIDMDGDTIRDTGDYEGYASNVASDESEVTINMTEIP